MKTTKSIENAVKLAKEYQKLRQTGVRGPGLDTVARQLAEQFEPLAWQQIRCNPGLSPDDVRQAVTIWVLHAAELFDFDAHEEKSLPGYIAKAVKQGCIRSLSADRDLIRLPDKKLKAAAYIRELRGRDLTEADLISAVAERYEIPRSRAQDLVDVASHTSESLDGVVGNIVFDAHLPDIGATMDREAEDAALRQAIGKLNYEERVAIQTQYATGNLAMLTPAEAADLLTVAGYTGARGKGAIRQETIPVIARRAMQRLRYDLSDHPAFSRRAVAAA